MISLFSVTQNLANSWWALGLQNRSNKAIQKHKYSIIVLKISKSKKRTLKRFKVGSNAFFMVSSRNSLNTPSWSIPASDNPWYEKKRKRSRLNMNVFFKPCRAAVHSHVSKTCPAAVHIVRFEFVTGYTAYSFCRIVPGCRAYSFFKFLTGCRAYSHFLKQVAHR